MDAPFFLQDALSDKGAFSRIITPFVSQRGILCKYAHFCGIVSKKILEESGDAVKKRLYDCQLSLSVEATLDVMGEMKGDN